MWARAIHSCIVICTPCAVVRLGKASSTHCRPRHHQLLPLLCFLLVSLSPHCGTQGRQARQLLSDISGIDPRTKRNTDSRTHHFHPRLCRSSYQNARYHPKIVQSPSVHVVRRHRRATLKTLVPESLNASLCFSPCAPHILASTPYRARRNHEPHLHHRYTQRRKTQSTTNARVSCDYRPCAAIHL